MTSGIDESDIAAALRELGVDVPSFHAAVGILRAQLLARRRPLHAVEVECHLIEDGRSMLMWGDFERDENPVRTSFALTRYYADEDDEDLQSEAIAELAEAELVKPEGEPARGGWLH